MLNLLAVQHRKPRWLIFFKARALAKIDISIAIEIAIEIVVADRLESDAQAQSVEFSNDRVTVNHVFPPD
jgi:hypothetical protein